MKKSCPDHSIEGCFFVGDRFATDQFLKDVLLVSITAVRCDEYFVHFVQSKKKK